MKNRAINVFWGIILILVAGVLLAERMGYIDLQGLADYTWALILAGASLLFFFSYFLNGVKKWGWLFPAFICAALALTIWLVKSDQEGSYLGTPILIAIALPFYIGFFIERKSWGLLIPAWILTITALITLFADSAEGSWVGSIFLFGASFPFLIVFLKNRTQQWALIPAWVLFVLSVLTLLADSVNGNLIGALFLYASALPFLVVYLLNRSRRWALIPAIALAVIGTFPLLDLFISGDFMGLIVMLLFAAPFFFVYFYWKSAWWAIIPAGIFTSIAIVVLLSMIVPKNQHVWDGILTGINLIGFGTTFGFLWLRRRTLPTDWAKYPAIALLTAGLLAFFFYRNYQDYWAVILLVIGVMMIVTSFLPKKAKEPTLPSDPS